MKIKKKKSSTYWRVRMRRTPRNPWDGWKQVHWKQHELVKKLRAGGYVFKGNPEPLSTPPLKRQARPYGPMGGEVCVKIYANPHGLNKCIGIFLTDMGPLTRSCEADYLAQGYAIIHGADMRAEVIFRTVKGIYLAERRRLCREREQAIHRAAQLGALTAHTDSMDRLMGGAADTFLVTREHKTCVLCLCVVQRGECCRRLPCMHYFHTACIDPHLRHHGACPTCAYDALQFERTRRPARVLSTGLTHVHL